MKTYEDYFDEFATEMASSNLNANEQNNAIEEFNEQFSLGFFFDEEDEENGLIIFK